MKTFLFIAHYGTTPEKVYKNKSLILDGGSNIHIHLIKKLLDNQENHVIFSTYFKNYIFYNFFCGHKRVKFLYFSQLIFLFRRYVHSLETFIRTVFLPIYLIIRRKVYYDVVISSSDFLPDTVYAFYLKLLNKKKWIAAYFLDAPKPWAKDNPYDIDSRKRLIGFLFWITQRPAYWIIKRYADVVLVTSEPDVKKFINKKRNRAKIIVVRGGVDIKPSQEYLNSGAVLPLKERNYDVWFLGRFHYQKGVLVLIDIWNLVCKVKKMHN